MRVLSRPAAAIPLILLCVSGVHARTALIPRAVIFGNPDKAAAQISPNGRMIGFVAPVKGVLNVWVGPASNIAAAKPVTSDRNRGVTTWFWAFNNRDVLYVRDRNGDENSHIYSLDLQTHQLKDLTPFKGIQARVQGVSRKFPDTILVGINNRNPQLHDIYSVNVRTGARKLMLRNDAYIGVMSDDDLRLRMGVAFMPSFRLAYTRLLPGGQTKPLFSLGPEDMMTTSPVGFDRSGGAMFIQDSRGRDKVALTKLDLATGKLSVLATGTNADISGVMQHPTRRNIQAVSRNFARNEWQVLDPLIAKDFAALKALAKGGDFNVADRSLDDSKWIVTVDRDDGPVSTYLYDRATRKAHLLFVNRAALLGQPLSKMHAAVVKARDGREIVCYLTLPKDAAPAYSIRPQKPLPMVLWIHGGPWARDEWGYNPVHQWLANRGYAVLSVNYRGSTGYGKSFINAANRQWGGTMHNDVLDAVKWAVSEKVADPKRIAITGGSYGGYETLVGVSFSPTLFACGVDLCGPSNLITWMKNIPPYWMPILPLLEDRVGDVNTEEGRSFLTSRSPITRVSAIRCPMLVGQGANDPRVVKSESDQMVKALAARKVPVTYLVYPDEGHGLEKPKNRLSFFAVEEAFLAKYLGGRFQPIGNDLKGSSIKVPNGASQVPGLGKAIKRVASR